MTQAGWLPSSYAGLRVLDLSSNLAGPLAAMVFGDLGADVIKVEHPDRGDDTRNLPPSWEGTGTIFLSVNRNKRSVGLDLHSEAGRDALLLLVESADLVVESFGPGVAERLGLDFASLCERNPRIVSCSVSAFGSGPVGTTLPGYDSLIQGFSGMMSITGHADGPPARVAPSSIDLSTGLWLVIATMAALRQRDVDGEAQRVEVALIDTAFNLMGHQVMGLQATGRTPVRLGTEAPSTTPNGAFATADGWIVVATANDRQFARLCAALELDELAQDPRFAGTVARVSAREELRPLLAERFAARPLDHWLETLATAGVPAGRVQDLAEALAHPLTAERRLLVAPEDQADGDQPRQLRLPIDPDGSGVRRPPPRLGEHTEEVLRAAGLDDAAIRALRPATPDDAPSG